MTIHSEDHMDDILKELIASGEIDAPVSAGVVNYFISQPQRKASSTLKKEVQKKFMAARFKAITRNQKELISSKQVASLTFSAYLTLVKSKLKATDTVVADACRLGEQELLNIINTTQNIFSTSAQIVADIIDGFSIPMGVLETLLKNTLAIAKEKGNVSTTFLRADNNAQGVNGAYEAGLLAIIRSVGIPPANNDIVDSDFLLKIKEELIKRGRGDLLH